MLVSLSHELCPAHALKHLEASFTHDFAYQAAFRGKGAQEFSHFTLWEGGSCRCGGLAALGLKQDSFSVGCVWFPRASSQTEWFYGWLWHVVSSLPAQGISFAATESDPGG